MDAFAVQNCFEANYGVASGVTVLLNAGASAINVNIVRGDQSLFTRDISIGGNAYTEATQKEFGLTFEAAELAKQGIVADGVTFEDVRAVLRTVTDTVLLEIEKTFDFFKATTADEHIDRIVICGGASRVDGFGELLSERFGPRSSGSIRSRRSKLDPARLGGALPDDVASTAAVAVGLALRRAGDR